MKKQFDHKKMVVIVKFYDSEENEREIEFPGYYQVCSECNGKGSYVNPAIDGHGISAEEWENEWDYEEREMYMNGGYDVKCECCDGMRVEMLINEDSCKSQGMESELIEYKEYLKEYHAHLRECAAERAMGA